MRKCANLSQEIDQHWLRNVAALRPFDASQLLRGKNPFRFGASIEGLFAAYRDRYPPDREVIEILVALTEYETNTLKVFSTWDPRYTQEERERFEKASTAMPHLGISPIPIRNKHYFDGGYLNNLPIHPLAGRDLDEIWLIPLFPFRNRSLLHRAFGIRYPYLRRLSSNAYVNSLLGLFDQAIHPVDLSRIQEHTVVVAPSGFLQAMWLFQPAHALNFSERNIRHLLEVGHADGTSVCRRYLEGRSEANNRR